MSCTLAKLMAFLFLCAYASEDALWNASCDGEEQDATVALQLRQLPPGLDDIPAGLDIGDIPTLAPLPPPAPCKSWCAHHINKNGISTPWETKCTWQGCIGCDQCAQYVTTDVACADNDSYRDPMRGYACSWFTGLFPGGWTCSSYFKYYGMSEADIHGLTANCPLSCDLCPE